MLSSLLSLASLSPYRCVAGNKQFSFSFPAGLYSRGDSHSRDSFSLVSLSERGWQEEPWTLFSLARFQPPVGLCARFRSHEMNAHTPSLFSASLGPLSSPLLSPFLPEAPEEKRKECNLAAQAVATLCPIRSILSRDDPRVPIDYSAFAPILRTSFACCSAFTCSWHSFHVGHTN